MLEATSKDALTTHSSSTNYAGRSLAFSNSAVAVTTLSGKFEAAALAEPRQPLERPIKDAGTLGLYVFLHVGVALSFEGRELHDLDAPKDARSGVRNPRCLVHRPDDLCGWRDLLGVAVLAVHDDSLAGDQGVDDMG